MKKDFLFLMFIYLVALIGTLTTSGCASKAVQSEALLESTHHSYPSNYKIIDVPFVKQKAAQCGPATLTMAMNHAGHMISVEELAPQVMTADKKGTLQQDMISASRRNGLMAVEIEGFDALLKEVSNGHPVVVFENLALTWLPQWHYAIVHGYDLDKKVVYLHSGPEENKEWNIKKFERSWQLGDYWGLVVLRPNQVALSAGELANLAAAAGLEQAARREEAQAAYEAVLAAWPHSLGALIGLGNLAYAREDYHLSVLYLKRAVRHHPNSSAAHHNLGVASRAANIKLAAQ